MQNDRFIDLHSISSQLFLKSIVEGTDNTVLSYLNTKYC